jgi:hypothetical protein
MPVIRGEATYAKLTDERRAPLLKRLKDELNGMTSAGGPVVFEIPLEQWDRKDVLVVWSEFELVSPGDRTNVILEAYADRHANISQAIGLTYQEAIEQDWLPFAVQPMARAGDADQAEIRKAIMEEGGIQLAGGRVDLRFPTMSMAQAAYERLCRRIPHGYWSVARSLATASTTASS